MGLNWNGKVYLTTIIFMIPLIILSVIILSINIKTSNLESIISSPDQISSECYNLTYSFINEQKSDEKYLSLFIFKIIYSTLYSYNNSLFYKNILYCIFFTYY